MLTYAHSFCCATWNQTQRVSCIIGWPAHCHLCSGVFGGLSIWSTHFSSVLCHWWSRYHRLPSNATECRPTPCNLFINATAKLSGRACVIFFLHGLSTGAWQVKERGWLPNSQFRVRAARSDNPDETPWLSSLHCRVDFHKSVRHCAVDLFRLLAAGAAFYQF